MWIREEARNRKHPPWVLLQSDERKQKQHWLSAGRQKRAFDHLGAHHFLMLPPKHDYQEMSPLTLYAATSTLVIYSFLNSAGLNSSHCATCF